MKSVGNTVDSIRTRNEQLYVERLRQCSRAPSDCTFILPVLQQSLFVKFLDVPEVLCDECDDDLHL